MSKGFVVTIFAAGDNENSPAEAVHFVEAAIKIARAALAKAKQP